MQTSHAMECGQNFSLFGLYSFFPSGVLATPSGQIWRKAQGAEGTGVEDLHQKIQAPSYPHPPSPDSASAGPSPTNLLGEAALGETF